MKHLRHNTEITVNGKTYVISYEDIKFLKETVYKDGEILRVFRSEMNSKTHKEILRDWLVEQARRTISRKATTIASKYNLKYKRIAIKDTKTRWGSCSSDKNLNFSWKLILVDPVEMEYVVTHELAHLRVMDHSPRFWAEVYKMMPKYAEAKKGLREREAKWMLD